MLKKMEENQDCVIIMLLKFRTDAAFTASSGWLFHRTVPFSQRQGLLSEIDYKALKPT
jgi:hypothetical protein